MADDVTKAIRSLRDEFPVCEFDSGVLTDIRDLQDQVRSLHATVNAIADHLHVPIGDDEQAD